MTLSRRIKTASREEMMAEAFQWMPGLGGAHPSAAGADPAGAFHVPSHWLTRAP